MSHTTERCYDIEGGRLKLVLETDHGITEREVAALDRVAESYLTCFEKVGDPPRSFNEDDEAIYELGGEENVTAG
jgi:hypothetical protein